jgi:RNA polymerase sigma-70 factor (ECF subfamily)
MAQVTENYEELRPYVFSVAYRMLGSVAEAEDIAQEAFLRLDQRDEVDSPRAYAATVATRLAIDRLRSAQVRREQYFGPWLPEPLVDGMAPDAAEQIEMGESLSIAFLVLLETLSPVERAVYVLHEAFDYSYAEIAEVVERSEENCRQIAARARKRIDAGRPRFDPSPEERAALAERFFAAAEEGDMDGLVSMLAADATMSGDGGGKATAAAAPVVGAERVARFIAGLARTGARRGVESRPALVNGQPGLAAYDSDGLLISVLSLEISEGAVQAIHSVVNPDKLGHLGPVSDFARVSRERTA